MRSSVAVAVLVLSGCCFGGAGECDPATFAPACDGQGQVRCEMRFAYGVQRHERVWEPCEPGNACEPGLGVCVRAPATRCDPATFTPRAEGEHPVICAPPYPLTDAYELAISN